MLDIPIDDSDIGSRVRTPRQRYASWASSLAGREAKAYMYRRQLGICLCCARPCSLGTAEIDHYIPIKDGGAPLDESNMYIICRPCNRKKGTKKPSYKIQVQSLP
jgi:5-methylcytosine-specific restriction endonuclease McrA